MSRVLLHSLVFAPDGVSTAYIMTDLAVELRRLGHQVSVLTATPHYNVDPAAVTGHPMQRRCAGLWYRSELQGIPIWHVTLPLKRDKVWARAIDFVRFHVISLMLGMWAIGRQDIVISTSPPLSIGAVSWLLGVMRSAPSVYKVAEVYPDLAIRQGVVRGRVMIGLMKALERFVYARNARIVTIAEQFREVIRERGVPDRKLRVISDCVDTDLYRPMSRQNDFAHEHGLMDRFVVLYGGNVGLVQDWESVLYGAQHVRHLPIVFVIVGDGMRRAWLAAEIETRGLTNVQLLGYQPKDRMPEINAACDLFMIPLTGPGSRDGFPSKIYSSLASGRPVLVSAPPGSEMAELVIGSECGRAVPPDDGEAFRQAVERAYRERDRLPEEGRRGRELVERRFSKSAIAEQYSQLIRELTGG
jgi:colanic acid biosynthesis glycosyl transferase WcaI